MPVYDCGDEYCDECRRAFKDRTKAIANFKLREKFYATLNTSTAGPEKVVVEPGIRGAGRETEKVRELALLKREDRRLVLKEMLVEEAYNRLADQRDGGEG